MKLSFFLPLAAASVLLGPVPAGPPSRTFRLWYRATIREVPEDARVLEVWLPLPGSDASQTIRRVAIHAPVAVTIGREPAHGNQAVYLKVEDPGPSLDVSLEIVAERREARGSTDAPRPEDLAAEPLVPIDGPIRALALEATAGQDSPAAKARAVYETVATRLRYDKSGDGWGRGDARFACDARRGNCTDFHALLIGMARSVGLPARFAIGLPLPRERGSGSIPGYHCWAEIYVEGTGWVPVDASEAAKDPSRRDYFFGHHDENRLEFSRGRHLRLEPPQAGPPLNFFVYPYAEVDGRPHAAIAPAFRFEDVGGPTGSQ